MTLMDLNLTAPFTILVFFGLAILTYEMVKLKERNPFVSAAIAGTGIVVALYYNILLLNRALYTGKVATAFHQTLAADPFAYAASAIILTGALISVFLSVTYATRWNLVAREYYGLLVFSVSGMIIMVQSVELLTFVVGLEIASLALYTLTGLLVSTNENSREAALKYFIMGAFGSALLIFGSAIFYGITGSLNLVVIGKTLASMTAYPLMIYAAMALVLAGLFFKISVVPFHMWTPDVYDGAPTPVTAFMSVTIKAAGVLALYRIIFTAFPAISYRLSDLMMVLAIVTMTIGNLAALKQNGLKRMLAYSTIAHVGYILVGFTAALAATNDYSVDTFGAGSAIFFYLATYTFMNLGAFAIVLLFEKDADTPLLVDDMAGIGKHFPLLTAAFAVFLLSLAGIPPFSGFMGKFSLFFSAAKAGFFWLVLAGVINSLISVYYYLRVIVVMYTGKKAETGEIQITVPHLVVLFFTVAATIWLGIFPGTLLSIFKMAIAASF